MGYHLTVTATQFDWQNVVFESSGVVGLCMVCPHKNEKEKEVIKPIYT